MIQKRFYGAIPSTRDVPVKHSYKGIKLDTIIDLTPYRPMIINQGQVNGCVGCGVGGVLSGEMIKMGIAQPGTFTVSPWGVYNGARKLEGTLAINEGVQSVDAYIWVQRNGYIPWVDFPIGPFSDQDPSQLPLSAEEIMLPNFTPVQLDASVEGALPSLLEALQLGHLVSIGAPYFFAWEGYKGGMQPIYDHTQYVAGDHEEYFYYADNNQRYFKRANSWGTENFGQNNPSPDQGCEYIPFDQIPLLAAMGIDMRYATFTTPAPAPDPGPGPTPTPTPTNGIIILSVTPANATVTINGAVIPPNITPFTINPGNYTIIASAKGYKSAKQTITVVAGKTYPVKFNLTKSGLCIFN